MSYDPKYIIFDNPMAGEVAIIFPNMIDHSLMADLLKWDVLNAGFVSVGDNGHVTLYGHSTTLRMTADNKWASMVKRHMGLQRDF